MVAMIKSLGFKNYKEYLQSYLWYERRDLMLRLFPKCSKCNKKATEVHHLTYDNVGNEGKRDLLCLCRKCHKQIHGVKDVGD